MSNRSSTHTYQQVINGLRWIVLSRVLVQASSWILTLVTVRLLTPFDYGIISMSGVLTLFAGVLIDGGLGPVLMQRKDITDAVMRSANGLLILTSLLGVIAVQFAAAPAALFFKEPQLQLLLRVACLQFVFGALAIVPSSMLASRMQFRQQAFTHVWSGFVQGIVTIALAFYGFGYWSLMLGTLISGLLRVVMLSVYAKIPLRPSLDLSVLRPYLSFARYTLGERFLFYFIQQTDSMIVGRLLGSHQLGVFAIAKQISHTPLDKIGDIASQMTLPAFSQIQHDRSAITEGVRRLMQLGAVISFPTFWGLMVTAPISVPVLLGPGWSSATLPMIAFCSVLPLRATATLLSRVVVGVGRPETSFQNQLLWPLIVLPALIIGVRYQTVGVAVAWAVSFPIMFAISTFRVAAALQIRWSNLLAPLVRPALAAGIMALLVWIVDCWLATHLPNIARLIVATIVGAAGYLGALRLVGAKAFTETLTFLLRFAGKGAGNSA